MTEVFGVFDTRAVNGTVPADCTVEVVGVMVTATAGETVIWKGCDPATLLESVTLTPKLVVPLAVGDPDTVPVLAARVSPAGNCPDEIENV